MMGARELLPVFFSYCRRMLRAFLLVALGGATLFVVTILYRAPLELPLTAPQPAKPGMYKGV